MELKAATASLPSDNPAQLPALLRRVAFGVGGPHLASRIAVRTSLHDPCGQRSAARHIREDYMPR